MRAAARFLDCSVIELAGADPSWRRMALAMLRAEAEAEKQRARATSAT